MSWRLGLRGLRRRETRRQALIRLAIPLDPSRYLELPWTLQVLAARPGERVLDLASPKLAAVALARQGVRVTSLDAFEDEIATWRALAGGGAGVDFAVADGRDLPYADATFDHAYSISVIEHIAGRGDEQALCELARVVRPGGTVAITLPWAGDYHEEWRDQPLYGAQEPGPDGRFFFERWYDETRLQELVAAVPELRLRRRDVVRLQPNWHSAYARAFPWLIALGPFYGLLARERKGPPGDVVRLAFERVASDA